MHLFDDVPHDSDRAGASCHDTGPHMSKAGLLEIRMRQHRNEHRRHAVESSDMLIVYAGKRRLRREVRNRKNRAAVGHRCSHSEYHAEAVEHRHLNHHTVFRGQIHSVADTLTVIDNIVMCQHNALRESRRSGCILHIADIVHIDCRSHAVDLFDRRAGRILEGFLPGQRARHAETDCNNIAQERKTSCMERLTRLVILDFRAEFIDDAVIIGISVAFDHDQRMRIRLAKQILRFMNLVSGIHRDKNSADLRGCPESQEPLGNICRPDRDLGSGLDAEGYQRAGKLIDIIPELAVCSCIIQCRKADRRLIRELFDHGIQNLRKRLVNQVAFLPDVPSYMTVAPVEMAFAALCIFKWTHPVLIMRQNDLNILKSFHPVRIPLERYITVVVDRAKGVHEILKRKLAFTDQFGNDFSILLPTVMNVHMFYICTQICDRRFGALSALEHSCVHIPEGCKPVVRETIQEIAQTARIRVGIRSLDKYSHRFFSDYIKENAERLHTFFRIALRSMNADAAYAEIHGYRETFRELSDEIRRSEVLYGVDTRQLKMICNQMPSYGCRPLRVRRTALSAEDRAVYIIKLDALHARVNSNAAEFIPAHIIPILDRE